MSLDPEELELVLECELTAQRIEAAQDGGNYAKKYAEHVPRLIAMLKRRARKVEALEGKRRGFLG